MLVHLSVRDIALIDALDLALMPGMTVLTGETGAGKSILLECLTLLRGERASADVVRTGATEASVSGQFVLDGQSAQAVNALLAEHELPGLEDGALVLRRVISRAGRHKQFINGALSTVAQLRAVAEPLVDFTGQHAHQALLRADAQLELLDAAAGHDALRKQMRSLHESARALASERQALRDVENDKERRLDHLRFYLDEIDGLAPRPHEDRELKIERARLQNAGKLRASLGEAQARLVEQDPDGGDDALTRVQKAALVLSRGARDDATLLPLAQSLEQAALLLDDVARDLARRARVEDDPARLDAVEGRLDALDRVSRKHGGSLEALFAARERMGDELARITHASDRIAALDKLVDHAIAAAAAVADALTEGRTSAAAQFAHAVAGELKDLGMPRARVDVRVERAEAAPGALLSRVDVHGEPSRALLPTGSDRVELWFSANSGEELAPLAKVASGGELSRVLLAVKRVLLAADPVPVSVFDEVDAGVGGAVGDAIGEKLAAIAVGRQVFCITHLPQIASRADTHLIVEKHVEGGRTVSRVRSLDNGAQGGSEEARVDEIARMLSGRAVTDAVRQHARELRLHGRPPRVVEPATSQSSAAQEAP